MTHPVQLFNLARVIQPQTLNLVTL